MEARSSAEMMLFLPHAYSYRRLTFTLYPSRITICTMRAFLSCLDSFSKFKIVWSGVMASPKKVTLEIPSARFRGLFLKLAHVNVSWSSYILHNSGHVGEMREHIVISSWFGIAGSVLRCKALFFDLAEGSLPAIGFYQGSFFCYRVSHGVRFCWGGDFRISTASSSGISSENGRAS